MVNGLDADKLNNGTPMHDERESPKIDLVDQWHERSIYSRAATDVKMNKNNASQTLSANAMDIDANAKQTMVSMTVPHKREVLA